jgi:hypothetical protein
MTEIAVIAAAMANAGSTMHSTRVISAPWGTISAVASSKRPSARNAAASTRHPTGPRSGSFIPFGLLMLSSLRSRPAFASSLLLSGRVCRVPQIVGGRAPASRRGHRQKQQRRVRCAATCARPPSHRYAIPGPARVSPDGEIEPSGLSVAPGLAVGQAIPSPLSRARRAAGESGAARPRSCTREPCELHRRGIPVARGIPAAGGHDPELGRPLTKHRQPPSVVEEQLELDVRGVRVLCRPESTRTPSRSSRSRATAFGGQALSRCWRTSSRLNSVSRS